MTPAELDRFNFAYDSLEPLHPSTSPGQLANAFVTFNLHQPAGPTTRALRLDLANLWLDGRLNLRPKP